MSYDPSLHTVEVLRACGVKASPFAGVGGLPRGGTRYSYRSAAGALAMIDVPAA